MFHLLQILKKRKNLSFNLVKTMIKIFKFNFYIFSWILIFCNFSHSNDLKNVVNYSIRNNLEFLNQKKELINLSQDIIQTKEKKKLSITGFLNAGRSWDFKCINTINDCVDNSFTGGFSNSYSLFDGGIIDSEIENNKLSYEIKELIISDFENNLIYDVIQAYLNVLTDRNLIELSKKNIEVLNQQFNAAESRFALGEITQTEVSQASARIR